VTIRRGSGLSLGSRRGQAALEVGLLLPWLVISFMAVLDFGFCAYGLIATQSAAKVIAAWGSATSANASNLNNGQQAAVTKICNYAIDALQYAPNVGSSVTTCSGSSPIRVSTTYNAQGADKLPTLTVTVNYTVTLLAVPGISPSSITLLRTVQSPVRN
jgi:Flp pilus assembly protein TadG